MRRHKSLPKNEKETLEYIDVSSDQLDEMRLSGLNKFKNIQMIRKELLKHRKKRLEAKHFVSHPKVMKVKSRLRFNKEMYIGLDMEVEKASIKFENKSIKIKSYDNNSWRLHGKLFDINSTPIKGVTVFFSAQNKKWIELLGINHTNETGYYSLTATEKRLRNIKKNQPIYLSVSDKNKKIVYLSSENFFIIEGYIVYPDIYILKYL